MGFPNGMIGVNAARVAALELEEDLENATILLRLTVAVIVLVISMTYRTAILKIVVSLLIYLFISHNHCTFIQQFNKLN